MAAAIAEAVGAANMRPESKEAVIALLHALPLPAVERRYLYATWARQVGVAVLLEDFVRVAPIALREAR